MATAAHRRASAKSGRGRGVYLLIVTIGVFVGLVLTFGVGIDYATIRKFDHVSRAAFVPAPDPLSAVRQGLPPESNNVTPLPPSIKIRAISVYPDRVELLAGGLVVRKLPTQSVRTLIDVVEVVDDESWIAEHTSGAIRLYAALIVERGATLMVHDDPVRVVQMVNAPGVFIGVDAGGLAFENVEVRAITDDGRPADTKPWIFRPFVLATHGSTLTAHNTTFSNLGYDWNGSYGVSWMDGSTGSSEKSVYTKSFIGVYTDHARGIVFDGDTYSDNKLYGMDPHSGSNSLLIANCTAQGNGAHGIIFSDGVVSSRIRNCVSTGNGENGVMMDKNSTGNTIEHNIVQGNEGDGIALSDSPNTRIEGNTVSNNRVGLYASRTSVANTTLSGNTFAENNVAAQGLRIDQGLGNREQRNGAQWLPRTVMWVWILTAFATLALLFATVSLRRRRGTAHLAMA